jgi:hypothetical protein
LEVLFGTPHVTDVSVAQAQHWWQIHHRQMEKTSQIFCVDQAVLSVTKIQNGYVSNFLKLFHGSGWFDTKHNEYPKNGWLTCNLRIKLYQR